MLLFYWLSIWLLFVFGCLCYSVYYWSWFYWFYWVYCVYVWIIALFWLAAGSLFVLYRRWSFFIRCYFAIMYSLLVHRFVIGYWLYVLFGCACSPCFTCFRDVKGCLFNWLCIALLLVADCVCCCFVLVVHCRVIGYWMYAFYGLYCSLLFTWFYWCYCFSLVDYCFVFWLLTVCVIL